MKTGIYFIAVAFIMTLPLMARGQGFGMGQGMGQGAQGPRDEKKMVIKAGTGSSAQDETTDEGDDFLKKPPSFQMFSLSGYMRLRSDWMYRLNLGYHNHPGEGIYAPFQVPLSQYMSDCYSSNPPARCKYHTLTSTNMRLRVNPVLRPSDTVSIHSTIDIFDNLVLGSNPSGFSMGYGTPSYMPYAGFDGNSAVYEQGSNSAWDSIRIKSLYGKVNLKLFDLAFGRMPNHFGLGLMHNGGEGYDADYGDYVDRVQITSLIPNWDLKVGLSWDFASQGLTSQLLYPNQDQGQPIDMDDFDDNTQWTAFAVKRHTPREKKRLLLDGKVVVDYGAHISYSRQRYSMAVLNSTDDPISFANNDPTVSADQLEVRKTTMISPDLWFSLAYRSFSLEMELAGKYGWITDLKDTVINRDGNDLNYLGVGGVLRLGYKWSSDVTWKLEFGYASGDDEYEQSDAKGTSNYAGLP
ncbi:hypothetical protein KKF84_09230, partial [Myxococcota bacterium]|nr:hypothetical protein [Myxococcota bacterium]